MRDLGQVNFQKVNFQNRRSPIGKIMLRVLVVFVLATAVVYFLMTRIRTGPGSTSVILKDASTGLVPVAVDGTNAKVTGGVDLATQTATLVDVKYQGEAKATAPRSFGGGVYNLTVTATLPDPKTTQYAVWLIKDAKLLLINYMTGAKTSWNLVLRDSDKYSQYDGIWITLERLKDELPEEHVMEGSF